MPCRGRFEELRQGMVDAHEKQLQERPHLRLDTEQSSMEQNVQRLLMYIAED